MLVIWGLFDFVCLSFLTEMYTVKVLECLNESQKFWCAGGSCVQVQWNIWFKRDGSPLFFKVY